MLLCLMIILTCVMIQAQEAPPPTVPNILFVGVTETINTELDNSTSITAGYGLPYKENSRYWFLPNFKVGSGGSSSALSPESAYMFIGNEKLYVGFLLGPNFDITKADLEANATTYLTAASGLMIAYDLNKNLGLWTYTKYKTQFGIESAFKTGFDIGGGIHFRLFK